MASSDDWNYVHRPSSEPSDIEYEIFDRNDEKLKKYFDSLQMFQQEPNLCNPIDELTPEIIEKEEDIYIPDCEEGDQSLSSADEHYFDVDDELCDSHISFYNDEGVFEESNSKPFVAEALSQSTDKEVIKVMEEVAIEPEESVVPTMTVETPQTDPTAMDEDDTETIKGESGELPSSRMCTFSWLYEYA